MIYELINLADWKKAKDCINELNQGGIRIDERQLRQLVKVNNINFINHEVDTFIVHSKFGYKATKDRDEILASMDDKYKRAINMLKENHQVMRALSENNNFQLDLEA